MPTVLDLITTAATKLGAIQKGEELPADEANDSLDILVSWLDSESTVKGMIYQIQQESLTWTASSASLTIGSGGDFSTTRPIKIEEGTYFRDGTVDYPVTILRDRATYDSISSKTDSSTYPDYIYYEPSNPLGTLYVYPVPSSNITFKLNSWKQLQAFTALTDSLAMPPGYQWMIENNLAVHLEPVFNIPCPAATVREAAVSKKRIKRINHVPITSFNELTFIVQGRGRSDIEAGT